MVKKRKFYQNISCFFYSHEELYLIFFFLICLMSFLILYILYPDSNFKEDVMETFEEILPTNISMQTKIEDSQIQTDSVKHKIKPILFHNHQAQKIEDENVTKYIYLVNIEGDKSHRKLFSEDWFHHSKNQNPI